VRAGRAVRAARRFAAVPVARAQSARDRLAEVGARRRVSELGHRLMRR
jgi:hypothetical protein